MLDEPTTALDKTTEAQVLDLIRRLRAARQGAMVIVTHDLNVVADICDRVLVMYAGRVVEELDSGRLSEARHPYTQGLLNCLPALGGTRRPLPVLDRLPQWAA